MPSLLPPHTLPPPTPLQAAEHFKDATATCLVQWGNVNIVKVGSGSRVQGGKGVH